MTEKSNVEAVDEFVKKFGLLKTEIAKKIIGQERVIDEVLISVFSGGHSLLVGVPGLAKTLLVNTIAKALGLSFSRIQFTPDLMPSDIIGSEILNDQRQFQFIKGPLFANIILADEINRTPPKTQSALLEAMQEKAVTVAGERHVLQDPFFVLATQNPIEQEGTYPLPEAQLDRFMFNIFLTYPSKQEEISVVMQTTGMDTQEPQKIMSGEEILAYQQLIRKIPVTDNVVEYAVNLAVNTRPGQNGVPDFINQYLSWGAGPRASQFLILGAKAHAASRGKYTADIEDVQAIAEPILRHRIVRNFKAEADGISVEEIIQRLQNI